METTRHPLSHCPQCHHAFDSSSSLEGERPAPGDVSLCIECGAVLVHGVDLVPRAPTPDELRDLQAEPGAWAAILAMRHKIAAVAKADIYHAQLSQMAALARAWRDAHPTADVLVRFNYPPGVTMIATISQAVARGVVSTNPAGLALIRALWPWDRHDEPTVNMVRAVLEHGDSPCDDR